MSDQTSEKFPQNIELVDKLTEYERAWRELLDEEELAFQKCVQLDHETHEKTREKAEAVRQWWEITNSILWMFTRTRAQFYYELSPFPMYVFGRLANISEELSNGIIPSFVEDARGGRGRRRRLSERKHIAYGVLYIEAVRRGEILDRSPNKTVRQAYGVTAKAVQKWMRERNELCVGVPHKHLTPTMLSEKMFECAKVYHKIGRGAPAHN